MRSSNMATAGLERKYSRWADLILLKEKHKIQRVSAEEKQKRFW